MKHITVTFCNGAVSKYTSRDKDLADVAAKCIAAINKICIVGFSCITKEST